MFGMNFLQALLIILFAAYRAIDMYGPQTFVLGWSQVGEGLFVGLVLGNPAIGMEVGATLSLMSLGVVGLGGASFERLNKRVLAVYFKNRLYFAHASLSHSAHHALHLNAGVVFVYNDAARAVRKTL